MSRANALCALVERGHDGADDLQTAELFGRYGDQHISPAWIILGQILREIAAGRGELSLWSAELLEHQGIRRTHMS